MLKCFSTNFFVGEPTGNKLVAGALLLGVAGVLLLTASAVLFVYVTVGDVFARRRRYHSNKGSSVDNTGEDPSMLELA